MDISKALQRIRPGAQWGCRGNTYEGIDWLDEKQSKPTELEIAKAAEEVEKEEKLLAYRDQRAAEYPPIGDQLDALWKGGAEQAAMKSQIEAVKLKYPKPQ